MAVKGLASIIVLVVSCWFAVGTRLAAAEEPGYPTQQQATIRVGPIEVPPSRMTMNYGPFTKPSPTDFAWTKFAVALVDAEGTKVPATSVYMHHTLVSTCNRSDVVCGSREDQPNVRDPCSVAAGVGGDYTAIEFHYPHAYVVPAHEQWIANYHLVSNEPAKTLTVFIEYTFTYFSLQANKRDDIVSLRTLWFDVVPLCRSAFEVPGTDWQGTKSNDVRSVRYESDGAAIAEKSDDPPPEPSIEPPQVYIKSRSFVSRFAGKIHYALGHLHKGGLDATLSVNGELVCHAPPVYNPEDGGYISKIGICFDLEYKVEIGDLIEIVGLYDNSQPISEAMTIFLSYGEISQLQPETSEQSPQGHHDKGMMVVMAAVVAISVIISVSLTALGFMLYRRKKKAARNLKKNVEFFAEYDEMDVMENDHNA